MRSRVRSLFIRGGFLRQVLFFISPPFLPLTILSTSSSSPPPLLFLLIVIISQLHEATSRESSLRWLVAPYSASANCSTFDPHVMMSLECWVLVLERGEATVLRGSPDPGKRPGR
ncbi:hypothetical protein TgHK011_005302 [Trichoderma gracile]|nr:hypothetical protein TgHK011_005302 [Trichoderma gracile]